MADQQIFEEQRVAQGETEARMSLIGRTRKAGSCGIPTGMSSSSASAKYGSSAGSLGDRPLVLRHDLTDRAQSSAFEQAP